MDRWLCGAALLALCVVSPTLAQENGNGDPVLGEELATQLCSSCHVVGTQNAGTDAAPPFQEIAADPDLTLTELHAWPGAPHPVIPDLALGPAHIADINAYLESLRLAAAEPEEAIEDEPELPEEPAPPAVEEPEVQPEGAAPRIEDEEPPPAILESPPEEVGPPIEPQTPPAID